MLGALMISLFIYLFYRTDKTVINDLIIKLMTERHYFSLKQAIQTAFPLNDFIIFSLPEGLWIFCITLTSKAFYIPFFRWKINGIAIPLLWAFGLELLQLLGIANGRFDYADLTCVLFFWFIAAYLVKPIPNKQRFFKSFDNPTAVCIFSYAIIYLAHVWK